MHGQHAHGDTLPLALLAADSEASDAAAAADVAADDDDDKSARWTRMWLGVVARQMTQHYITRILEVQKSSRK